MNQAQAAQGAFSERVVTQVGDHQTFFISYDNVFNNAGPVNEDADLATDIGR
jgi:hypothetical protein